MATHGAIFFVCVQICWCQKFLCITSFTELLRSCWGRIILIAYNYKDANTFEQWVWKLKIALKNLSLHLSQVDVILFIGWGPTKKGRYPRRLTGNTPFELGHVQNTIRVDKMIRLWLPTEQCSCSYLLTPKVSMHYLIYKIVLGE